MRTLFQWLERLSLDAVMVAVVWGIALGRDSGNSALIFSISILGCATWLTYVSDRLWEVRPGRDIPATDRHLYYRNHYKVFAVIWLAVFILTVLFALLMLPLWKLLCGWLLVGLIVLYLLLIGMMNNPSARLLLKRTLVPMVFTCGVVLMAESWGTPGGIAGSVLLLSAALVNVLLISYWESHDENRPEWLVPANVASLVLLLICAHVALFMNWVLGLAGLICAGGYFYLLIQVKSGKAKHIRTWVDAVLVLAGMFVVLA